jgi:outer membrane lipoprotein-sorting protein
MRYAYHVCAALLCAATPLWAGFVGEPQTVQDAFNTVNTRLGTVTSYQARFVISIKNIKGDITQSGTLAQQLPFVFRRDMHMQAMGGIMNVTELHVCDGTNGWEVQQAPNGTVVNASHWGLAAVEELFYAFRENSYVLLVTPGRTNTYASVRREVEFHSATPSGESIEFSGIMRTDTFSYAKLVTTLDALGPAAVSNHMPVRVRLVTGPHGLARQWVQYNVRGEPVLDSRLSDVEFGCTFPSNYFTYSAPEGVMVYDLDRALQRESLHVSHPLREKPLPTLNLRYLSGREVEIEEGSGPMVITFFTSWSGACRAYIPLVEKMYRKYNGMGVRFLTITDETSPETVREYVKAANLTMPVLLDPDSKSAIACQVEVVPKTIIVDAHGVVLDVLSGTSKGIESALDKAIEAIAVPGPVRP